MQDQIDKSIKRYDNGKPRLVEHKVNGFKQNPGEGEFAVIEYYDSGIKQNEQSWDLGRKHGICRYYYPNGNKESETYWYHGMLHNVIGPAVCSYYNDGKPKAHSWWRNDNYYSDKGKPVYVEYDVNGNITKKFDFLYLIILFVILKQRE